MKTISTSPIWLRARRCAVNMLGDSSGVAATEFAVIVPLMLAMFFGTVEFSSGVAVDRKVTLVARTLSDLTSQSPASAQAQASISDTDLQNIFAASSAILSPYSVTPVEPTISEIYVDASKIAKIQWSKSATLSLVSGAPKAVLKNSSRSKGDVVTIPPGLQVADTYLIWSEVDYKYVPAVGYLMNKLGVTLHDATYTRPRYSACVDYPAPTGSAKSCTPAS
jgi:Flp pilus assembly protein TadG